MGRRWGGFFVALIYSSLALPPLLVGLVLASWGGWIMGTAVFDQTVPFEMFLQGLIGYTGGMLLLTLGRLGPELGVRLALLFMHRFVSKT